jgi:hypothetical protein
MDYMGLEALINKFDGITRPFRRAPYPFASENTIESEDQIQKNPEYGIDPFGGQIPDATIVIIADTHYHPLSEEHTIFDSTARMPIARIAQAARTIKSKVTGQGPTDWRRDERPHLFNNALYQWPNTIGNYLDQENVLTKTEHGLVIHLGDIGQNGLNQLGMTQALLETQTALNGIRDRLTEHGVMNTIPIQALGDHDADYRPWDSKNNTQQIEWINRVLGLGTHPACYFQKVADNKGVLILDTNLLEAEWVRAVAASKQSSLYPIIQNNIKQQNDIIQHARNLCLDEIIIAGHKPDATIKIAQTFENTAVTAITAHRHFQSTKPDGSLINGLRTITTREGNPIRVERVGAATRGYAGFEWQGRAGAKLITMQQDKPLTVYDVYQE